MLTVVAVAPHYRSRVRVEEVLVAPPIAVAVTVNLYLPTTVLRVDKS